MACCTVTYPPAHITRKERVRRLSVSDQQHPTTTTTTTKRLGAEGFGFGGKRLPSTYDSPSRVRFPRITTKTEFTQVSGRHEDLTLTPPPPTLSPSPTDRPILLQPIYYFRVLFTNRFMRRTQVPSSGRTRVRVGAREVRIGKVPARRRFRAPKHASRLKRSSPPYHPPKSNSRDHVIRDAQR